MLPGIEITSVEGVHILAVFTDHFLADPQQQFLGWLKITGSGRTREASQQKLDDILHEIEQRRGIVIVPHPKSPDIGMLDKARKLNIKMAWLESGLIRLMQVPEGLVTYIERDNNENFVNRYVLSSASSKDIESSTYCLAPFNRSDAQRPQEIPDGCSWFKMERPSVAGLKQVACEPRSRISCQPPVPSTHDCVMEIHVSGGYCDGQVFRFNDQLNCIIGENYAGKSAVFDFLRFAIGSEEALPEDSRERLLNRINGILGEDGVVEVFLRSGGDYYVVKRTFRPEIQVKPRDITVIACGELPQAYRLDVNQGELLPVRDFKLPIELYEQGRIGRLRDDVERQLDMLDEFAQLNSLKTKRNQIVHALLESAKLLKPLYEEREGLTSDLATLPELKRELHQKESLIPDKEEQDRWTAADEIVNAIEATVKDLGTSVQSLATSPEHEDATELQRLFAQEPPHVEQSDVAEAELLTKWASVVKTAVDSLQCARGLIEKSVKRIQAESVGIRNKWQKARSSRQQSLRDQLAKADVESPSELISRVRELRGNVNILEKKRRPQLVRIEADIATRETQHENLANQLKAVSEEITEKRKMKADELTSSLQGQIKVKLLPSANKEDYQKVLHQLCDRITSQESKISGRQGQLRKVVESITPLELAQALANKGIVEQADGTSKSLQRICRITENTQSVLCRIADDITLLTKLQTVAVPDVPRILVRRRRESEYANLRTGLSPGEQSAAILAIALQTRHCPLAIDQPEDELGHGYVVHLVVPKILEVKPSRQLLVITHNANIPVLGDTDYVIKMENRTVPGSRVCVVAKEGCFESSGITTSLLELEGGPQAFEFRRHRYTLT